MRLRTSILVTSAGERMLVGLNLGEEEIAVAFPARQLRGEILISSGADRDGTKCDGEMTLRANEGVVLVLAAGVTVPPSV